MSRPTAVQAGLSRSGSTLAWQIMCDLLKSPVCKTHEYIDYGKVPVVVTIRHPLDAITSLARASAKPESLWIVKNTANEMLKFMDRHKGPILVLRYESWWPDLANCVTQIADFFGIQCIGDDLGKILLRRNMTANKAIADRLDSWDDRDATENLHGNHIGSGKVGQYKSSMGSSMKLIANRELHDFMNYFGYEL